MRTGLIRETIKQLPAVLAGVAFLVTALQGCRKSERIVEQKQEIRQLEATQTNLIDQIKSISSVVDSSSFE